MVVLKEEAFVISHNYQTDDVMLQSTIVIKSHVIVRVPVWRVHVLGTEQATPG